LVSIALSLEAVNFENCSWTNEATFLYGVKKAWRMLMGLDEIRTMVASQSVPLRS
jgi:hypothetical protein